MAHATVRRRQVALAIEFKRTDFKRTAFKRTESIDFELAKTPLTVWGGGWRVLGRRVRRGRSSFESSMS